MTKIIGYVDLRNLQSFMEANIEYGLMNVHKKIPPLDKSVEPPLEFIPLTAEDLVVEKLKNKPSKKQNKL